MSKNKKEGYRRLAVLVSIGSFFVTYLILFITEKYVSSKEAIIEFPIISLAVSVVLFFGIRLIPWVNDGFKSNDT